MLLFFALSFVKPKWTEKNMKGQKIYEQSKIIHEEMYMNTTSSSTRSEKKAELYRKYLHLLRKAAYLGHPDAQNDLAQTYEDMNYLYFENPFYNPKKCIYWYTKASLQNHAVACNNLAPFYERGIGVKQNIKKALQLYKKSAELGYDYGKKNYKLMVRQIAKGYKFKKG